MREVLGLEAGARRPPRDRRVGVQLGTLFGHTESVAHPRREAAWPSPPNPDVIPAKAGIHHPLARAVSWIPAFAGMTSWSWRVVCSRVEPPLAQPVESFADFIRNFEATAVAAGVSPRLLSARDRRPHARSQRPRPRRPRSPSSRRRCGTTSRAAVSPSRIERGQARDREQRGAVRGGRAGATASIPTSSAAIWGIETDYGAVLDNAKLIRPIIRSLATLVHQRRGRLKEDEADFIAALLLARAARRSGGAGRLVGRRDRAPAGQPEQRHRLRRRRRRRRARRSPRLARRCAGDEREISPSARLPARRRLGVRGRGARRLRLPAGRPRDAAAGIVLRRARRYAGSRAATSPTSARRFSSTSPTGKDGPKFLMTPNYLVLKGYNFSDSYALSVAHLTDRLKGGGAVRRRLAARHEVPQSRAAQGDPAGADRPWALRRRRSTAGSGRSARRPTQSSRRRAARWRTASSRSESYEELTAATR